MVHIKLLNEEIFIEDMVNVEDNKSFNYYSANKISSLLRDEVESDNEVCRLRTVHLIPYHETNDGEQLDGHIIFRLEKFNTVEGNDDIEVVYSYDGSIK
jgi:hypothetical protein